jgi:hypothetical protein
MNILYVEDFSPYLKEFEGLDNNLFVLSNNTRKIEVFK